MKKLSIAPIEPISRSVLYKKQDRTDKGESGTKSGLYDKNLCSLNLTNRYEHDLP